MPTNNPPSPPHSLSRRGPGSHNLSLFFSFSQTQQFSTSNVNKRDSPCVQTLVNDKLEIWPKLRKYSE